MEVIDIQTENDILLARQAARNLAESLNFSMVDKTRIATAVSELARNMYQYANGGRMELEEILDGGRIGVRCVFEDQGPGILNIDEAMIPGFSTSKGLGHGLPGSNKLMDEMKITSQPGKGTRVEVVKWQTSQSKITKTNLSGRGW